MFVLGAKLKKMTNRLFCAGQLGLNCLKERLCLNKSPGTAHNNFAYRDLAADNSIFNPKRQRNDLTK